MEVNRSYKASIVTRFEELYKKCIKGIESDFMPDDMKKIFKKELMMKRFDAEDLYKLLKRINAEIEWNKNESSS